MTTVEPSSRTDLPDVDIVVALASHPPATAPIKVIHCSRLGMQANPPAAPWPFRWFFRR